MLVFFCVKDTKKYLERENMNNIFRMLPTQIVANLDIGRTKELEEIRLRANKSAIIKYISNEQILEYKPTPREIESILQVMCENSIYSYQSQIANGYITLFGGHRVGITGNVVMKEGKVSSINYVSSLNIRIAKEILGAGTEVYKRIVNEEGVQNTLIVSPPGCGKTTLLRDLVRQISDNGFTVSLIDERGEIAAMYKGIPQNDVGIRTDVIDNITKSLGMKIAIRTMAPQVIVADEIGTEQDIEAINYGICSGVKGIFTAHGSDISDLKRSYSLNKLLDSQVFKKIFFLERRGRIAHVYTLSQNMYKLDDEKL